MTLTKMKRRVSPRVVTALAGLALVAAPARSSAQPADLDKLIPTDALVYVAIDGLTPLQGAVTQLLDAVMPGQGGAMAGMMFMSMQSQPGMSEIDAQKPIYFSFLASEKPLFALPLANPADFEALLKTQPGAQDATVLAGQGYSLLSYGPIDLDALKAGSAPKAPALKGAMRGFVDLPRLLEKYGPMIEPMMAMGAASAGGSAQVLQAMNELKASGSRVDFALTPSAAGLDFAFSAAPNGDGLLATIARSSAPPATGSFLAAVPGDAAMAASISLSPDALARLATSKLTDAAARKEIESWSSRFAGVLTGSQAFGLSASASGTPVFTQVMGVSDVQKARSIMKEMLDDSALVSRLFAASMPGVSAKCSISAGTPVAGAETDEIKVDLTVAADADTMTKTSAETMKKLFAEPVRVAYAAGAIVSVAGPGAAEKLEQALKGLAAATPSSAAAKSVPAGHAIAGAANIGGILKAMSGSMPAGAMGPMAMLAAMPPGKEHFTFTVSPSGGAAEVHVNLPSGAIRELVQPMMGGMGPR